MYIYFYLYIYVTLGFYSYYFSKYLLIDIVTSTYSSEMWSSFDLCKQILSKWSEARETVPLGTNYVLLSLANHFALRLLFLIFKITSYLYNLQGITAQVCMCKTRETFKYHELRFLTDMKRNGYIESIAKTAITKVGSIY